MNAKTLKARQDQYLMAREQFLTALAVQATETTIKVVWKRMETSVNNKNQVFKLLSVAIATAWKNGYETRHVHIDLRDLVVPDTLEGALTPLFGKAKYEHTR